MKSTILRYTGVKTKVSYDVKRCIHAAECVHGLPDVFNPDRKPWIEPDRAEPEQLLRVVTSCPTGALHLESTDDGQAESPPEQNTATIEPNGPIYFRGDVKVVTQQGEILLEDTRLALCRCGSSENKPLCDGQHAQVGFEDDAALGAVSGEPIEGGGGGVRLTTLPNGPYCSKVPCRWKARGWGRVPGAGDRRRYCRRLLYHGGDCASRRWAATTHPDARRRSLLYARRGGRLPC